MLGVVLGASRRITLASSSSSEWWLLQASRSARSWHTRRHSPTPARHSQSIEDLESALQQAFGTDPLLHGHGFHGPGTFGARGGSMSCAVPQSTKALFMKAQLSRCSTSYVNTRLHVRTCMHMPCTHMYTCMSTHVHVYTDCCAHAQLSCKTQSPSSRLFVQQQPAAVRLPWGPCHPYQPGHACKQACMSHARPALVALARAGSRNLKNTVCLRVHAWNAMQHAGGLREGA